MIPPILLAYDVGPGIGLGHVARMRALAAAVAARGRAYELVDAVGKMTAPVVVVDSYRWRADDRRHFGGDVVVAVEDLDRDLAVDLVVDPFPGGEHLRAGAVLSGARYALLDAGLVALERRPVGPDVRRVVVTGGGSDHTGWAVAVARQLRADLPPATEIAVTEGPWWAGPTPAGVVSIRSPEGLGPDLAGADVVVTAAGVTMLEALVLGRPTVAAVLFPNQLRQAQAAHTAGAVVLAGAGDAASAAVALARDTPRRAALSKSGRQLIDGMGAGRVAEAIDHFG